MTKKQIKFIMDRLKKGKPFREIASQFNSKYKSSKKQKKIYDEFYDSISSKEANEIKKFKEQEERKEIEFIFNLKKEGLSATEIAEAYNNEFNDNKSVRAINRIVENKFSAKQKQEIAKAQKEAKEKKIDSFLKELAEYINETHSMPSYNEIDEEFGISRKFITYNFGNLLKLYQRVRETYLINVLDSLSFTQDRWNKTLKIVKKSKRFIITSAVTGSKVNDNCYNSLKTFESKRGNSTIFMPISDPSVNLPDKWFLDSKLINDNILFKEMYINSNVMLSDIKISAKQIRPTTGLDRISKKLSNGAFIFASPKNFLSYLPVKHNSKPKVMSTTTAITNPLYETNRYMSKRTSYFANIDHKMGGVVIEKVDDKKFFMRHIQFNDKGEFSDIDKKYLPNGKITKSDVIAITFGDIHVADKDPKYIEMMEEVCKLLKPDYVFLEDVFDGKSIKHWDRDKVITRTIKSHSKYDDLMQEANEIGDFFKRIIKWPVGQFVIKRGNHELFLDKWLEKGTFLKDNYKNTEVGIKLAGLMIKGGYPFQNLMEDIVGIKTRKIRYLREGEFLKLSGIEHSRHGHQGINKPYGCTMTTLDKMGKGIYGHAHSPEIRNDAYRNGTGANLNPDYASDGPNTRAQSFTITFRDGTVQMVQVYQGKYKLKD